MQIDRVDCRALLQQRGYLGALRIAEKELEDRNFQAFRKEMIAAHLLALAERGIVRQQEHRASRLADGGLLAKVDKFFGMQPSPGDQAALGWTAADWPVEMVQDYVDWSHGKLVYFSQLSETSQEYLELTRHQSFDPEFATAEPTSFTGNRVWASDN